MKKAVTKNKAKATNKRGTSSPRHVASPTAVRRPKKEEDVTVDEVALSKGKRTKKRLTIKEKIAKATIAQKNKGLHETVHLKTKKKTQAIHETPQETNKTTRNAPRSGKNNTPDNTTGHKNTGTIGQSTKKGLRSPAPADASNTSPQADSAVRTEAEAAQARMDNTMRRLFRKGRLLRPEARPPSDKLIKAICAVIKQGNYPEVACRAFGIQANTFRQWVQLGFEDIQRAESTQYALFVVAVDTADAQAESQDISMIRAGIEDWQALAWLRERKSFQRWGIKSLALTGSVDALPGATAKPEESELTPEVTTQVLAALEEAGVLLAPDREHLSGIPSVINVEARSTAEAEGYEEVAVISD